MWTRWIKGVIPIEKASYFPYVFLTADSEDGPVKGLHFHYYKDTRPTGGKLKHGHGPGGPPVLGVKDVFVIVKHLLNCGILNAEDVRREMEDLQKNDKPVSERA